MGNSHRHWRVVVETSGEHIVSIEPEMLAGREISEADEDVIRTAAHHLLAFIGDSSVEATDREGYAIRWANKAVDDVKESYSQLLDASKKALSTLRLASRQLTEDHRMVLCGRGWGWRTLAELEGAIAKAETK